ncbi:MAG: hypothetical protein ACFFDH_00610 [Promethearchaeota archaeon]
MKILETISNDNYHMCHECSKLNQKVFTILFAGKGYQINLCEKCFNLLFCMLDMERD